MKKLLLTSFQSLVIFTGLLATVSAFGLVLRASLLLCSLAWSDTTFLSGIFTFVGCLAALVISVSYFIAKMEGK